MWRLLHKLHGSYDTVEAGLNKTLKGLDLDYLDLYLMHWPVGKKNGAKKVHLDYVEVRHIPSPHFTISLTLPDMEVNDFSAELKGPQHWRLEFLTVATTPPDQRNRSQACRTPDGASPLPAARSLGCGKSGAWHLDHCLFTTRKLKSKVSLFLHEPCVVLLLAVEDEDGKPASVTGESSPERDC